MKRENFVCQAALSEELLPSIKERKFLREKVSRERVRAVGAMVFFMALWANGAAHSLSLKRETDNIHKNNTKNKRRPEELS